ncbi:MAG TPA: GAF domain-containing protein [Candidatus Binatia bacterium]|nr:GAF domain-containing protein [Candidatus Binatia bacterium]
MDTPGSEMIVANDREVDRLQTLYLINDMLKQVVAEGLDTNTVLPRILRVSLEELEAFSATIILLSEQQEPELAWLLRDGTLEERDGPFLEEVVSRGLFAWTIRNLSPAVVTDTRTDERWLKNPLHATTDEAWSAICSPLVIRNRAVGAITMTRPGVAQFDRHAVDLLNAIANQTASTIESARLYQESQRRADELAALVNATAVVSSSLELQEVLEDVAGQMARLIQVDACTLFDGSVESTLLTQRIVHAPPKAQEKLRTHEPIDARDFPRLDEAVGSLSPAQVHVEELPHNSRERRIMAAVGAKSALLLPMVAHDNLVGLAALIGMHETRHFSEQEINLAQMLANQAAIAIENARHYEDTQRQLQVSALLNEASKVINSTLDTNEILQSLLAQMNELLNAEALSIALVDKSRNELVYEIAEGIGSDKILGLRLPSNQGISGWVMEHGQPALVQDTASDPRFYRQADERTGHDTRAIICAPLQVKGEVLGTIQAINPRQGTFTEDDLQLWVNLANLASSALANAQQYARTQAAEARYLSLFQDSVSPILLTGLNGIVVEANRRAQEFLGYPREELIGLPILSLHSERDVAPNERIPELSEIHTDRVLKFIADIMTRSEQLVPVEGYVKRTLSGETELLQWIYRDISQQIELEEMRGDLTAMLVHDLQSPLGNIISSLELLRYELPADVDPVLDSIVDIAVRSSRRLQTLIRSLLDITHLEAGHPISEASFVDVGDLIEDACEVVQPALERRQVDLKVEVPEQVPRVFVDADMIGRVLINLLDNASKHTPETREVKIAVQRYGSGDYLLVTVSDQGQGIPSQYREVIFEKFRRLQGPHAPKGMGLGLAFCRLAINAHGGQIWVDDAPSAGARFNFTLPTRAFPLGSVS